MTLTNTKRQSSLNLVPRKEVITLSKMYPSDVLSETQRELLVRQEGAFGFRWFFIKGADERNTSKE